MKNKMKTIEIDDKTKMELIEKNGLSMIGNHGTFEDHPFYTIRLIECRIFTGEAYATGNTYWSSMNEYKISTAESQAISMAIDCAMENKLPGFDNPKFMAKIWKKYYRGLLDEKQNENKTIT